MIACALQEMQGEVASHRNVLCSLLLAHPTGVFTQRHLEASMQRIFHPPMLPHGLGPLCRLAGQRRQGIARFHSNVVAHLAARLHHADTLRGGLRGLGSQPVNTGVTLCLLHHMDTSRGTRHPITSRTDGLIARVCMMLISGLDAREVPNTPEPG